MHTLCRSFERWRDLIQAGKLLGGLWKVSESQSIMAGAPRPGLRSPSSRKHARKINPNPNGPQTRGQWIYLKRIEADLSRENVAQKMGVCDLTVRAWECDECAPTEAQWQQLKEILETACVK
jgi:ribosome-binding protein aMBF1 (putative translation factor)